MPVYVWVALTVATCSLVAGPAAAGLRGWRAFRAVRAMSSSTGAATVALTASMDDVERRSVGLSAGGERLEQAVARLQRSLAELKVLTDAAEEVQAVVERLTGLIPRK